MDTQQIKLSDGRKLAYIEYGDPKGKPMFYFHGWPTSRLSGVELDNAAKKLCIRVISPDRPGFGLSDYQQNRTLLDWPKDVIELANSLHIGKFAVIGISGGGPYTAVCASKIPHRLTKAGIIVGLAPTYIPGILKGMALTNYLGWNYYSRFPLLRKLSAWGCLLQAFYFPRFGRLIGFQSPSDREIIKSKPNYLSSQPVKEAFRQGIKGAELDLKIYTHDWGFNLSDIQVPVFLWYGADDKNVPLAMGNYYHSQIPKSKLFINPTGGHLSRLNHEAEILKLLI